ITVVQRSDGVWGNPGNEPRRRRGGARPRQLAAWRGRSRRPHISGGVDHASAEALTRTVEGSTAMSDASSDTSGVGFPPPLIYACGFAAGYGAHRLLPVRLLLVASVVESLLGLGLSVVGVNRADV